MQHRKNSRLKKAVKTNDRSMTFEQDGMVRRTVSGVEKDNN
jgi:hypothetical protein